MRLSACMTQDAERRNYSRTRHGNIFTIGLYPWQVLNRSMLTLAVEFLPDNNLT